jgi:hypothetical protein
LTGMNQKYVHSTTLSINSTMYKLLLKSLKREVYLYWDFCGLVEMYRLFRSYLLVPSSGQ